MVLLKSVVIWLISLLRFFKLAQVLELNLRLFFVKNNSICPSPLISRHFLLLLQQKFSNNHHTSARNNIRQSTMASDRR